MADPAVSVEGLGKCYRLGFNAGRRWRARLADLVGRRRSAPDSDPDLLWALRDASFSVARGEAVGIIGRNGAGKSTLLKILSRIVAPTTGRAVLRGRVGCLLEVGAGFHPDLSGRENIYLSGAILGLRWAEIRAHFDQIVAFAEIDRFLDTPVKRYSSGMYIRLAFAVAAHLQPEILIVDEVLAVGDLAFQHKCLSRMRRVAQEGRTVLFVSHNLAAISTLTQRALYLEQGRIREIGPTPGVVAAYLATGSGPQSSWRATERNARPMQILRVELAGGGGADRDRAAPVVLDTEYEVRRSVPGAVMALTLHASDGALLLSSEDTDAHAALLEGRPPGRYRSRVVIPGGWLNQGQYAIRLTCGVPGAATFDTVDALRFVLVDLGNHISAAHRGRAYFMPRLDWHTEAVAPAPASASHAEAVGV